MASCSTYHKSIRRLYIPIYNNIHYIFILIDFI
nr:MAG TPA: hypothetical protein [Caudoviricetes sp.]